MGINVVQQIGKTIIGNGDSSQKQAVKPEKKAKPKPKKEKASPAAKSSENAPETPNTVVADKVAPEPAKPPVDQAKTNEGAGQGIQVAEADTKASSNSDEEVTVILGTVDDKTAPNVTKSESKTETVPNQNCSGTKSAWSGVSVSCK